MNVLIIEDSPVEATLLARLVGSMGLTPTVARSGEAALAIIAERAPEIVLTDHQMPGLTGAQLVEKVRAMDLAHYVYVIMRTGSDDLEMLSSAFGAGVDDFIGKSRGPAELRARLRAGERIVRLEAKLRDRVQELERALRRLELSALAAGERAANAAARVTPAAEAVPSANHALVRLAAWHSLPDVLAHVIGEFIQAPVERADDPVTSFSNPIATSISLADITHNEELSITLVGDGDMVRQMAIGLFGEVDDETVVDFLSELANIAMGATKTAFVKDEYMFTGGLPKLLAQVDAELLLDGFQAKQQLAFRSGTTRLYAFIGARHRTRVRVPVTRLREGMVLAEDVVGPNGVLLLRAGTRITESVAERIARTVPKATVELADVS